MGRFGNWWEPLDILFTTKCRGHLADDKSDCYDCQTWVNQGRSLQDLRGDSIHRCIREKLLDAGPTVIRWSGYNSQCFIDYSACVN